MFYRTVIGAMALAAAPFMTLTDAQALDNAKYPDWKGQWMGGWPPLGYDIKDRRLAIDGES
jgi:hypothetical protein